MGSAMGRRLLLLRHAKSSWSDAALDDRERPLNGRGERAAAVMGTYLAQRGALPSLVLCSSAERARQTARRVLGCLDAEPEVRFTDALYGASANEALALLRAVSPSISCVLVIGHNPCVEDLALALAGSGTEKALARLDRGLPTSGLAELELDEGGWASLAPGSCRLVDYATPKELV